MSDKNIITLDVAGTELKFEPNLTAYNQLINSSAREKNAVGVVNEYLTKIVTPDSRAALKELLLRPGAGMQISQAVNDEYAPALDIEVKKSSE
ncbi:putative phage tail assembly chaperone [Enterobacter sichuanensis]|uniref:putative phage tail assembly chaperone n=1 Tax=Enterobacter sichuanensis TaxID=2071710 RepID=UPI002DBD8C27|nr:putative phage tail assembly chaperone [Enterobacter sichuanensis]MEB5958814.1 putative phage tail assembly chaperone [Enterobacter sichuanensis]